MTVEEALRRERIGSLPLPPPVRVARGTGLQDALQMMREEGAGCLLVCDGDRLAGIFTERDVLNKLFGKAAGEPRTIDALMTQNAATLTPGDSLADAIRLMTEKGYRHIPLIGGDGKVAGLIAANDIVHYIAEHFPVEVVNLPPELHQTFTTKEGA